MKKEELLKEIDRYALSTVTIHSLKELLDEFFKDKVIIQRGDNRHPYADVLHEWIEGIKVEQLIKPLYEESEWLELRLPYFDREYRIKPKEPIYEWQWVYIDDGVAYLSDCFLTIDEAIDKWDYKIQETKRERKQ